MLEGIIQIGNSMLSGGGDMLSNLIKDVSICFSFLFLNSFSNKQKRKTNACIENLF